MTLSMSIINLSLTELRSALRLLEQRNDLLQQVAEVDRQLAALEGGKPAPAPQPVAATKPVARAKAGGRRKLKDEVISLLQSAGASGMTVGELAGRLGVGVNRIFTWFYATGKKVKQIKKIGNAQYRWVG